MQDIYIITLFPEMVQAYLDTSIMKKAQAAGVVSFSVIPLREFGLGKYKQVDDAPYGGGAGMLLRPEPVFAAVDSVLLNAREVPRRILLTPQGARFTQQDAERLSKLPAILLMCGHYEGFDERIRIGLTDEEISIGDFVLTGGELPALVVADAVVRLMKGVLPEKSLEEESFTLGMMEYPQYTRPPEFRGMAVPEVLQNGNHQAIKEWRKERAEERTRRRLLMQDEEGKMRQGREI